MNGSAPGAGFRRMRWVASGLLLAMVVLLIVSRHFEASHPALGFVRAFAEAATIGGLADWFAVTALFRRPLGLPIPHTAIIPRSKDRIAEGLREFLASNFLRPEQIDSYLGDRDLAKAVADWLSEPQRRASLAGSVAAAAPRFFALIDDAQVNARIAGLARRRLEALDAASLAADAVALIVRDHRHDGLVQSLAGYAARALRDREPDIRARIKARTGWVWRTLGADEEAADALISALRDEISGMSRDPGHALRRRFTQFLEDLAQDLRAEPDIRADVEAVKQGFLDHPSIKAAAEELGRSAKAALGDDPQALAGHIDSLLRSLCRALAESTDLRATVNAHLRAWARRLADTRGADLADLVASTIRSWDAATVVERIEGNVGRDLQYIRINGTLVGGLVGLGIHAVAQLRL